MTYLPGYPEIPMHLIHSKLRLGLYVIFFSIAFPVCEAQTPQEKGFPFISNYDHKVYDAYPQCWSITQDHNGVMYFGSGNRINEYDGSRWSKINFASRSQSVARA